MPPRLGEGNPNNRSVLRIQTSLTIAANHGVNQWDLSRSMASSRALAPHRFNGFISDAFAGIFGRMAASAPDRRASFAAAHVTAGAARVVLPGFHIGVVRSVG